MTQTHVISVRTYAAVLAALLVLLGVTLGVALVDLGPWNVVVAMAVASVKAFLVMVYFMHLRFSKALVVIFAVAGFLWLVVLIVLTMSDYVTRWQ